MAVTYRYNGVDPFDGICAPPLLARSEEIVRQGSKIVRAQKITLSGEVKRLTCSGGFSETYNQTKNLILKFAQNFKQFQILEEGSLVYSCDNAIIESISFQDSPFIDLIPFQIEITCYQNNFVAEGIIDPVETFEYEESDGYIVNITHTISAKGFNTSSEALTNVINFVSSRTGYNALVAPTPSGYTVTSPILIKRNQSINKLTGEVTYIEKFSYDKSNLSGDRNYILDLQYEISDSSGVTTVSVSGKIYGAIDSNISLVRNNLKSINFYSLALQEYSAMFPTYSDLEAIPNSLQISENNTDNSISFTLGYRNNKQSDPFIIDSTTVTQDFSGVDCISVSILIKSIYGCPAEKLRKTKEYYQTFDLQAYVNQKWAKYGTGIGLGAVEKNRSYSIDYETGNISVEATYCTDFFEDCGCLENFNYTFTLSPSIPSFTEAAAYHGEGCYYIQKLNYNRRAKFSISGSARPSKCCTKESVESQIYNRINLTLLKYFSASDIILDSANIEYADDNSIVSFSFSWNGIQSSQLSDDYVYATFNGYLLLEDGTYLLLEDGSAILLE